MRTRLVISLLVAGAIALGACSSDTATTTTTTTTKPATTTSTTKAATTTTTTTAATTTTIDPAKLKSTDPVAVALDASILTAAELSASGTTFKDYVGTAAAPAPIQGPINLDGIVTIFPAPQYRDPLEKGGATVGANHTYQIDLGGQPGPVVNILAIKFPSCDKAKIFIDTATNIAVQLAGAQATPHTDVTIGCQPYSVLRVP